MNVKNLFSNNYMEKIFGDKSFEIRGLSLNDILENTDLMPKLFEVIDKLNNQEENFYFDEETLENNFNDFFCLIKCCVKNFKNNDKKYLSEVLLEILILSLPSKPKKIITSQKNKNIQQDQHSSKYVNSLKIEQEKEISKKEYLESLNISSDIFSYVELAEYLRTKNIQNPYDLSLNNLIILTQIHQSIENNYLLKVIDKDISSRSIFEGDDKLYIETITRLSQ